MNSTASLTDCGVSMLGGLAMAASLAAQAAPGECRVLTTPRRAGDPVYADDAVPAVCPPRQPPAQLRYDPHHKVVRARVDLAAGAILGRAYLPLRPTVTAGQAVQITAALGNVVISRQARVLQPARRGQRFFARLADGTILTAPPIAIEAAAAPSRGGGVRHGD